MTQPTSTGINNRTGCDIIIASLTKLFCDLPKELTTTHLTSDDLDAKMLSAGLYTEAEAEPDSVLKKVIAFFLDGDRAKVRDTIGEQLKGEHEYVQLLYVSATSQLKAMLLVGVEGGGYANGYREHLMKQDYAKLAMLSAGQSPDPHIVKTLKDIYMTENNITSNQTQSQPQAQAPLTVKPDLKNVIDNLLSTATDGKLQSITDLIDQRTTLEQRAETLEKELANERSRAKLAAYQASVASVPQTSTVNGEELTYAVTMKPAWEIFNVSGAKKSLGIELPTLEWKNKNGDVVAHPETPAIDEDYLFDPIVLLKYSNAFAANKNTWLFGHTGTGKSTFIEQFAAHLGFPVSRVNLDSAIERADLVGHISLTERNGATISEYEEGILPRSMQKPCIMLIDEIDAGRPDVMFVIQRALEGNGLLLTEDNNRLVKPHPLFRFAATANTRGQGDEYGNYKATNPLNLSLIDRFPVFLEFKYLNAAQENQLISKRCKNIDAKVVQGMVQMAIEIRKAFAEGHVSNTISPRGLLTFAEFYETFITAGMQQKDAFNNAFDMAIFSRIPRDNQVKFNEIKSRNFAGM